MSNHTFCARRGRGSTDFVIEVDKPFFSGKGYKRVRPVGRDARGIFRLRCYVLDKFAAGVPAELLTWLHDHGGMFVVDVVSSRDPDTPSCIATSHDAPYFVDERRMRLTFGDARAAMLFKLTFGGV